MEKSLYQHEMFYSSLCSLCGLTMLWKEAPERKQLRYAMSHLAWLKEMCTVRFGSSRQIGHSTSALKLISYLEDTSWMCNGTLFDAYFLSPSHRSSNQIKSEAERGVQNPYNTKLSPIFSPEKLRHLHFKTWNFYDSFEWMPKPSSEVGMVVVDCAFSLSKEAENHIYTLFSSSFDWTYPEIILFLQ